MLSEDSLGTVSGLRFRSTATLWESRHSPCSDIGGLATRIWFWDIL